MKDIMEELEFNKNMFTHIHNEYTITLWSVCTLITLNEKWYGLTYWLQKLLIWNWFGANKHDYWVSLSESTVGRNLFMFYWGSSLKRHQLVLRQWANVSFLAAKFETFCFLSWQRTDSRHGQKHKTIYWRKQSYKIQVIPNTINTHVSQLFMRSWYLFNPTKRQEKKSL